VQAATFPVGRAKLPDVVCAAGQVPRRAGRLGDGGPQPGERRIVCGAGSEVLVDRLADERRLRAANLTGALRQESILVIVEIDLGSASDVRSIGDEFAIELHAVEPRIDPPPGTSHVADVVLRARRR
jgi:hypothetical protein